MPMHIPGDLALVRKASKGVNRASGSRQKFDGSDSISTVHAGTAAATDPAVAYTRPPVHMAPILASRNPR